MTDQVLYDDDEQGDDIDLDTVDWGALVELQSVYDQVLSIEDPADRLVAAKRLVNALGS